jgi:hypothetical protein
MTMLDRRVAQIYVSTDCRTTGSTYNSYVIGLSDKYGRPDKLETKYYRNGFQSGRRNRIESIHTSSTAAKPSKPALLYLLRSIGGREGAPCVVGPW